MKKLLSIIFIIIFIFSSNLQDLNNINSTVTTLTNTNEDSDLNLYNMNLQSNIDSNYNEITELSSSFANERVKKILQSTAEEQLFSFDPNNPDLINYKMSDTISNYINNLTIPVVTKAQLASGEVSMDDYEIFSDTFYDNIELTERDIRISDDKVLYYDYRNGRNQRRVSVNGYIHIHHMKFSYPVKVTITHPKFAIEDTEHTFTVTVDSYNGYSIKSQAGGVDRVFYPTVDIYAEWYYSIYREYLHKGWFSEWWGPELIQPSFSIRFNKQYYSVLQPFVSSAKEDISFPGIDVLNELEVTVGQNTPDLCPTFCKKTYKPTDDKEYFEDLIDVYVYPLKMSQECYFFSGQLGVQGKRSYWFFGKRTCYENIKSHNHLFKYNSKTYSLPFQVSSSKNYEQIKFSFSKVCYVGTRTVHQAPSVRIKDVSREHSYIDSRGNRVPGWLSNTVFKTFYMKSIPLEGGLLVMPYRFNYESNWYPPEDVNHDFSMNIVSITPLGGGSYTGIIALKREQFGTDKIVLQPQTLSGYFINYPRGLIDISHRRKVVSFRIIRLSTPTKLLPGPRLFHITAISQAKKNLGLAGAEITKSTLINVPEYNDFFYGQNIESNIWSRTFLKNAYPHKSVTIPYQLMNRGNVPDTLNITARLDLGEDDIVSWSFTHSLKKWGTYPKNNYEGSIEFHYEKDDIYPPPGIYPLYITVTSSESSKRINHIIRINFREDLSINTSISPTETTMLANWETNFTFTVHNTGNVNTSLTLEMEGSSLEDYLYFPKTIPNLQPNETKEIIASLKINNPAEAPVGSHQFRITAYTIDPDIFDSSTATVKIFPPDFIPPGIYYSGPEFLPYGLVYPQTSLNIGPKWNAIDDAPNCYELFIDEVLIDSDNYTESTEVQLDLGSLTEGVHNVTITFNDTSGNMASDTKWVTIEPVDTIVPNVTSVTNDLIIPENFENNYTLSWNVTEEFLLDVALYLNGVELSKNLYTFNLINKENKEWVASYVLESGSLAQGSWNFTLETQDMGNNFNSSSIFVDILSVDSDIPSCTEEPDSTVFLSHNESISLTFTDSFPSSYSLWVNGLHVSTNNWQSNVPVILMLEELQLEVGENDLRMNVTDLSNNILTYNWTLNAIDIDPPVIISGPTNYTVYEHNVSYVDNPVWLVNDTDPQFGEYFIYRDNVLNASGIWSSGNGSITVSICDLLVGNYRFDAVFKDASGNVRNSTIFITVEDILAPMILNGDSGGSSSEILEGLKLKINSVNNPAFKIENSFLAAPIYDEIVYEPLYTASWFEFIFFERHYPVSYDLYLNGSKFESDVVTDPHILVDIEPSLPGKYYYTIELTDRYNNTDTGSIIVYVDDFTPPIIKQPPDMIIPEGMIGNSIHWQISEANSYNFSLYRNAKRIDSRSLTNLNLTTSLDTLAAGEYIFILIVFDLEGFSHSCTCHVSVIDITAPTLSHISDCRFQTGDPSALLVWKVSDLHPATYIISRNGEKFLEEEWDGNDITFPLVGWSEGIHTLELVVQDASGNSAVDVVKVTLVEKESVTTYSQPPGISTPGFILVSLLFTTPLLGLRRLRKKKKSCSA